jgi:hypothetical protein
VEPGNLCLAEIRLFLITTVFWPSVADNGGDQETLADRKSLAAGQPDTGPRRRRERHDWAPAVVPAEPHDQATT